MTSVTDLLLEILKCRLIHGGSHQLGSKHTAEYDAQLAIPPVLVYGNKFGTVPRDVESILQIYEVQYYLACGKACGGFNGRASLKALAVSYTLVTLPTNYAVYISLSLVSNKIMPPPLM